MEFQVETFWLAMCWCICNRLLLIDYSELLLRSTVLYCLADLIGSLFSRSSVYGNPDGSPVDSRSQCNLLLYFDCNLDLDFYHSLDYCMDDVEQHSYSGIRRAVDYYSSYLN